VLLHRRTLASPISLRGDGLFTARPCTLTIHPAPAGTRLRLQLPPAPPFIIDPARLSPAIPHPAFARIPPRCTTLAESPTSPAAFTVEHALSALAALGVTDAVLTLDHHPTAHAPSHAPHHAPHHAEVPILDGSSLPFTSALARAGLKPLDPRVAPLTPAHPITVTDGPASVTIEPADTPSWSYTLDYTGTPAAAFIPPATVTWDGSPDTYLTHVAPARTYCLLPEAEQMRTLGLFTTLSPRDMLVLAPDGPIDNDLRLPDEPARHKLLDLIGDLALVNRPIRARITAVRSGHALHHKAAAALLAACADPSEQPPGV
jgi:UDP-3-O-acyl-N-acetylglucosamine deacetylase